MRKSRVFHPNKYHVPIYSKADVSLAIHELFRLEQYFHRIKEAQESLFSLEEQITDQGLDLNLFRELLRVFGVTEKALNYTLFNRSYRSFWLVGWNKLRWVYSWTVEKWHRLC
ncbi:hypothetical protein TNIN_414271 [Trichonephila inaurata madagascariensis]|uniref:Uncharacterized protein n=1 Tax=Trichonephila inaurata madagascariensis TaxID=2747483 RepID=A0A8X7BYD6_9ARAC|nr:hypothetical protein TNIN_414271 [Trichonephila inaurata madagascariensis]